MKRPDTDLNVKELWQRVSALELPHNYWHGRAIEKGLAPDEILLFPHRQQRASPKENFGNYHPRFVFDLVLGPPTTFHLAGYDYRLHAGEAVLIFPHQHHYGRDSEGPEQPCWAVTTFDLKQSEALEPLRNSPRRLREGELKAFNHLTQRYHAGAQGVELSFLLSQLLLSLCDAPTLPPERTGLPTPQPERDAFLARIDPLLTQCATLPELAAAMGESAGQLRTLFRLHTGSTPGDYIRRHRLSQAARLLQRGEANVTEIAERLGFSSVNAFSRMFKAVYGLPPKQYEKITRG